MVSRIVHSIDVWALAKILGVMGLLWGLVVAVTWVAVDLLGGNVPGLPELLVTVLGGTLYGVVGGAITAVIYDAAASIIGGRELELS